MRPIKKAGESPTSYKARVEDWKLSRALSKTGMHGTKQSRNRRWRVAELERKLTLSEDDNW